MTAREYYVGRAVDCALAAEHIPCDRDVLLRMATTYVLIAAEIEMRQAGCPCDIAAPSESRPARIVA